MGSLDIMSVDVVIEDDGEFVGFEDPSTGRPVYLGRFARTGPGLRKLRVTVVPGRTTEVYDITEKFVETPKEEVPVKPVDPPKEEKPREIPPKAVELKR